MNYNLKISGMMLFLTSTVLSMSRASDAPEQKIATEPLITHTEKTSASQPSAQNTKKSSNFADDFFRGEELPSFIAGFYAAAYNPNNPVFEATDEKDAEGRTIYVTTVNGIETGERYAEVIDNHGRLVGFDPLQ